MIPVNKSIPEYKGNNSPRRLPGDMLGGQLEAGYFVLCWSPAKFTGNASFVVNYRIFWTWYTTPTTLILRI